MLAYSQMMIVCPKCGFSQPKDQFCAQCGVDISQYQVKLPPLWKRFLQNPDLHLFLIGCLVVVVLGYIFYTQRALLGDEVGGLLKGLPLLSKDSSDTVAASSQPKTVHAESETTVTTEKSEVPSDTKANGFLPDEGASTLPKEDGSKAESPGSSELEVSFWAVPREAINSLVSTADKSNDGGEGRVLVWQQSSKVAPVVESSGQQLEGGASLTLASSPLMVTDGAEGSPLQFSLNVEMKKATGAGNEYNVKMAVDWHMPTAEVGRYVDASIDGNATIPYKGAVMVILDPADRSVRADLLKGVSGPMSIFASDEFKAGLTDWVILIHQK